ncbi:MAG: replication-relaxation family protein [Candidatus Obscuribacterales bacterium]|nr:replication-relaxation family protein [Candidatus Obscuribacterales bacterium]
MNDLPSSTDSKSGLKGPLRNKARKKNIILMQRDLAALEELYHHRTISSSQLAKLCFPEISYETARKRLRRLQQSGYMGAATSGRMEGRGRPELIYFLSTAGAKILEQDKGISWETIPTGPPHLYHKEHFLRLVDIRLAMTSAEKQGYVDSLEWSSGREFWRELSGSFNNLEEQSDATLQFAFPTMDPIRVLIEMDTGNFRQHRHWEPKIKSFLKLGHPIWVITGALPRILTLRKWTAPLLEEAEVGPGKCVFAVYSEIMQHGIFGASWYRTDGTVTNLRPRLLAPGEEDFSPHAE